MNIKTNGPVDLCFSNGSGPSADTISTIGQSLATVGAAAAQRQRQFTELEQKCGKKPVFPGKARNRWYDCQKAFSASIGVSPTTFTETPMVTTTYNDVTPKTNKVPTWAWVVGGVAVLGIVGLVIYKSTKK